MTRKIFMGIIGSCHGIWNSRMRGKETPAPATVSGQPAGAEKTGGEKMQEERQ